jgi:hypothetical protein
VIRGLQLADIDCTVRALLAVPAPERAAVLDAILRGAALGAAHHRITGGAHPQHGTGTLMSAVSRLPAVPRPAVLTPDYLRCLALVATITARDMSGQTFDLGDDPLCRLTRGS